MKTSILCVSYRGDFDWLPYLLKSYRQFCSGFHEFVMSVPQADESLLRQMDLAGVRVVVRHPKMTGYFDQQLEKCCADLLCPEADCVCHVDSDCVFLRPTTPDSLFVANKPFLLITPFAELGSAVPWKPSTELALGIPVEFEGMRRHGLTYWRDTYQLLRERIETLHGVGLDTYLSTKRNSADHTKLFSEFNCLTGAAFAWQHDKYHWIDTSKETFPPPIVRQFWSHHRASHPDVQKEIADILKTA